VKFLSRLWPFIVLLIASLFLVSDLLLHSSRNITFDGHIHISTIAQFTQALKDGELPVSWSDGFGSYGSPLPFFAHQTTSYLGALVTLITQDVVLSFNLLFLAAAVISTWLFYVFLKRHVKPDAALIASLLFTLAPYRIINIYIRGALPEFFATPFILLALIGIARYFKDGKKSGLLLLLLGLSLLALTHPMMLVISLFIVIPYFIFTIWPLWPLEIRNYLLLALVSSLALGICSYYVIPLFLEMKYLYQGLYPSKFPPDMFLGLKNFFDPNWYYYFTHPGPRGHFIQVGLLETIITLLGGGYFGLQILRQQKTSHFLKFALLTSIPLLFFLTPASQWFYSQIFFLRALQFPWRMLSAFLFIPPIILGILLDRFPKVWLYLSVTILIVLLRFPQLYGKNFVVYSQDNYYFNVMNLHGQAMTPIWAGNAQDYPLKDAQFDIIGGQGQVAPLTIKNASRLYQVTATTSLRLVDYTFYFPGWVVKVNGQETPIQFQDINYRGVITYDVPQGNHQVNVSYQPTKIRLFSRYLSLAFLIATIILYLIFASGIIEAQLLPKVRKLGFRLHKKQS